MLAQGPEFTVTGIDHIVLRVRELERAVRFYRDVLGCAVEREQPELGLTQLRAGHSLIDLVSADGPLGRRLEPGDGEGDEESDAFAGGPNLEHFCLSIRPFDEHALYAHLASFGVAADEPGERYGAEGEGRSFYIEDPDGNRIELKGAPVSLAGKTLFITGASRGIGLAIALRAARDGANVAIAAKTVEPHPKLPGTIYTAAAEIERAGGRALPLVVDVRDEPQVAAAVGRCAQEFGGIDICVNNASAINLAPTEQIEMRRYDLIQQINTRGTFVTTRACLPYLKRAANPHVLTLSPPLELRPRWFADHLAYSLSKYGMSLCMLGLAEEYRAAGIACNALWPRTTIATAAVEFALGGAAMMRRSRKPEIVADAAHEILGRPAGECTGHFFIDDEVLYEAGVRDFTPYSVEPGATLIADVFVARERPAPPGVQVEFLELRR